MQEAVRLLTVVVAASFLAACVAIDNRPELAVKVVTSKAIPSDQRPGRASDPGGIAVRSLNPAFGRFSGTMAFSPVGCEDNGKCRVIDGDLKFFKSKGWAVKPNLETDGASIPKFAWGVIGKPFDSSYLPAAVIHDNYCARETAGMLETHRAFYQMLRALGIGGTKSKTMYAAVLVGSHKWFKVKPGEPCGELCVRVLSDGTRIDGDVIRRPPIDNAERRKAFQDLSQKIVTNPSMSLDQIDNAASILLPEDAYLTLRHRTEVTPREFLNAPILASREIRSAE